MRKPGVAEHAFAADRVDAAAAAQWCFPTDPGRAALAVTIENQGAVDAVDALGLEPAVLDKAPD
jgi:hypothetical protein